jgi:hypothetical protein
MANGQSRIIGRVVGIGGGTPEMTDNEAQFFVQYRVSGAMTLTGQTSGEVLLVADITQAENQINNQLRAALAAHVDPLVIPPQGYVQGDVRGINI